MGTVVAPLERTPFWPPDRAGVVERLRLTGISAAYCLSFAPSLVLGILTVLLVPLYLPTIGFLIALVVIPATAALAGVHRAVSGALLGEEIPSGYADLGSNPVRRAVGWMRDRARWRDFGFLWFSATGGFLLSLLPVALLTGPVTYAVFLVVDTSWVWALLFVLGGPMLLVWWLVTPALVRARAVAERNILGGSRVAELSRRVEEVEETRSETLDHSAAEIRRIERDLHDGAQARIAAVGMSVGLAEKLIASDPEAAAALLREARESTVSALEDLRAVVRGILPPVLADQGLAGAVEALVIGLPIPVTVALDVPRLPAPIESAAYFAVAECLANTVKHSRAERAFVQGTHDGVRLRLMAGDDGIGGADPAGSGLAGVDRRLAAFDGTMRVDSPPGGGTKVSLEVPCPTG
ncbi:sensor histidine kinase [Nocardioides panacisoli]|uniref:histidine kinase n=1 Tax=Nocardioides panacisoli TaxID=627624 RepID=A0ABP7ISS1_9ACTN